MKTSPLNKKALLSVLIGLFGSTGLHAQTDLLSASSTGTNPVDFEFRSDGVLISKGNYGVGSLLSTDQGAGTRMLWYPALAAFRAGYVSGSQWNLANIGQYSVALGNNNQASGQCSTAMGNYSVASSQCSTAIGGMSIAIGFISTAMGQSTASGGVSTAMGQSTASGAYSTAMGMQSNASGQNSTAMGFATTASGVYSTAMGIVTTATSFCSTAVGAFNIGGGNASTWVPTDPLFEIGNGGGGPYGNPAMNGKSSDALVVYKNGNTTIQGTVTAPAFVGSVSQLYGALPSTVTVPAALITSGTLPSTVTVSGTIPASQVSGLGAFANGNASIDSSGDISTAGGLIVSGSAVTTGTQTIIVAKPNQPVLIPQQGDLSMGSFTVGQQP